MMDWLNNYSKDYDVSINLISESTFAPLLSITINNITIKVALTATLLHSLNSNSNGQNIFKKFVDEQIKKHPEYLKTVRKKKIEKLDKINE